MSNFFAGIGEQKLETFVTFSANGFGVQCCRTLTLHSQSLKEFSLFVSPDALPHLGELKGIKNLRTLGLIDGLKTLNLDSQHQVFLDIVEWITTCKKLHTLRLLGFSFGAAMATPVLLADHIKLLHFELTDYAKNDMGNVHSALANQPHLEYLLLESEQLESRDDIEILVQSLCNLNRLRVLRLIGVATYFNESHIRLLCDHLQGSLEELYIGGLSLGDGVLDYIGQLNQLRTITFLGTTSFSFESIFNLAESWKRRGAKGVLLAIDNADPDHALSELEQDYIREYITTVCDGRFEYTLLRGEMFSWVEKDDVLTFDEQTPAFLISKVDRTNSGLHHVEMRFTEDAAQ
jgi:hypothetical protein